MLHFFSQKTAFYQWEETYDTDARRDTMRERNLERIKRGGDDQDFVILLRAYPVTSLHKRTLWGK